MRAALIGVGATMASGNQLWNGYCADLVNAPSSTSTSATGRGAARRLLEQGADPEGSRHPRGRNGTRPAKRNQPAEAGQAGRAANRSARPGFGIVDPDQRVRRVIEVSSQHIKSKQEVVGEDHAEHGAGEQREQPATRPFSAAPGSSGVDEHEVPIPDTGTIIRSEGVESQVDAEVEAQG